MTLLELAKMWTLDTLLPRHCVFCGVADESICPKCSETIILIKQQQCIRCQAISQNGLTCKKCRRVSAVHQLITVAHYTDGPIKEALHTIKYHGRIDLIPELTKLIISSPSVLELLSDLDPSNAIIVPVPLHRRRLWWRGFNQSYPLARALQKHSTLPLDTSHFKRHKSTATQVKLMKQKRADNVIDAFWADATFWRGKTVVLVDDIVTTGATLNSCALALRQAGVRQVRAVALARAD